MPFHANPNYGGAPTLSHVMLSMEKNEWDFYIRNQRGPLWWKVVTQQKGSESHQTFGI